MSADPEPREDAPISPPAASMAPLDAVAVLESMGDAFYALDPDWRFTYANRRALQFWNVKADAVLGRSIWSVFPAMRGTRNEAALQEVAVRRHPVMFEGPSPTTGAFVSVMVSPIRGGGVAVYWRDITDRIRSEQRLRASEEHLRLAQEAGGIGTWEVMIATGAITGSAQMYRLLGLSPEAHPDLTRALGRAIHPEDRPMTEAAAAEFRARKGPLRLETRIIRPDGEIRWLVFLGQVLTDQDGRPDRMLGVCLDGTARHRAEEALRAHAERLRLAMKAGGLATWEMDLATGRRNWSPEAAAMHGFPPEQTSMSRREWARFIHPEDRARVAEAFDSAVASGEDYVCEYRILLPGGAVRWTATTGSVLRDERGAPVRVIGIVQDITARRRDEERLRELNRELEARVAEEVAARQAAQTRAAHAERMHALGQLAGGIAHDFNNILQAVQGSASLIERRAQDPDAVRRFARMVLDAVARGASITGRLLAFGRQGHLRAEPVQAGELLQGLREILIHALAASITVRLDLQDDLPAILADRGQLETVLVNLATNARDAMPSGGTLIFSARFESVAGGANHPAALAQGPYVRLDVADTGCGMEPPVLARASEPFFTTKPVGKGTGLGLAMARGFAEQSGGGLSIESLPGHGTRVSLWLPVAPEPEARPRSLAESPSRPLAAPLRVLLVDDDPLVRGTLANELEEHGFAVTEAAGAAEAMPRLEAGQAVDALVTDLSMPGVNGLDLIRAARSRHPGLPAVLLTGYAGDAAQLALGEAISGRFSILRKPVSRDRLTDCLAALLETRPETAAG